MISRSIPLVLLLVASCSQPPAPLVVKQFQLRDQDPKSVSDPLVRMEKERRLRGAVSLAERKGRLGQYYTILWQIPPGFAMEKVQVIFKYQQSGSGSQVKRMATHFNSSDVKGKTEFAIIGDDYFNNGRVLAWHCSLVRGSEVIATEQSYLWE